MAVNLPLIDVYWRVGQLADDTPADTDHDPDVIWADEGTVLLVPVVDRLVYTDENGKQATLHNAPKVGVIKAGGRIAWEGDGASATNTLRTVDLTNADLSGHVTGADAKTHTLVVQLVRAKNVALFTTKPTIEFDVRIAADKAGPDGVVNLAPQIRATATDSTLVDLRVGPPGPAGPQGATGPAGGVNKVAGLQGEPTAQQLVDAIATPLSAHELDGLTTPDDPRRKAVESIATGRSVALSIALGG
jgi:hypothetical protein